MSERLASNRQLYVLNRAGRLLLLPLETTQEPVTSGEADEAIKQALATKPESPADEGRSA